MQIAVAWATQLHWPNVGTIGYFSTVLAPFLVLAIAPSLNGEIMRDNQQIRRELTALSLQAT